MLIRGKKSVPDVYFDIIPSAKKIRRGGLKALLMTFAVNHEIVGRMKQAGCFVAEKKVGVLMRLIQSEWWLTTLSPGLELLQIL